MPRTDLIISAKAEGFDRVQQQTGRMAQEARRILETQVRGFDKLQKGIGQTVGAIKGMEKALGDVGKQMEQVTRKMGEQLQKQQTQMQRQGAFIQGLIQGAVPGGAGMFLQRGPGMGRQVAGMAVGRAARGVVGGAGQMLGGGGALGGLSTALSALPGGGLVAGQMQAVAGLAEQGLAFQRQRLGMVPFLSGGGSQATRNISGARRRAMAGVAGPAAVGEVGLTEEMRASARRSSEGAVRGLVEEEMARLGTGGGALGERARRKVATANLEEERGRRQRVAEASEIDTERRRREAAADADFQGRRSRAGAAAAARERDRLFRPVRRAGMEMMGINRQEALQQAVQILQAGGGNLEQLQQQGLLRTGFAAQTAFGVGPGVTGAFLQAGRRGGLSGLRPGTEGGGGQALTEAIGDAMRLGLEGSEINQYLQTMAEGISQWRQTGIPFAKEAIADFGSELGRLGLGGVRGAAVARGVAGAAQALSTRGPQTAQELLVMQTLGGLRPGQGGAAGFEQAQIQLEQLRGGQVGGEQLNQLLGQLMQAGGGGAAGRLFARQSLGQMGVNIGAEEFRLLGRQVQGEDLSTEERGRLKFLQEQRGAVGAGPQTPEELQRQAQTLIGEFGRGLKTAAGIQNEQIGIGQQMIPMLNNLNTATTNIAKGFAELAGEPLTNLTKGIKDLTEAITSKKGKGLLDALSDLVTIG